MLTGPPIRREDLGLAGAMRQRRRRPLAVAAEGAELAVRGEPLRRRGRLLTELIARTKRWLQAQAEPV